MLAGHREIRAGAGKTEFAPGFRKKPEPGGLSDIRDAGLQPVIDKRRNKFRILGDKIREAGSRIPVHPGETDFHGIRSQLRSLNLCCEKEFFRIEFTGENMTRRKVTPAAGQPVFVVEERQ